MGQTDDLSTAEKLCQDCLAPCVECSEALERCTNCGGATPFLVNDTCRDSCASNQYGVGITCIDCPDPCASCADADTCQSCGNFSGTSNKSYLLASSCVAECGDGLF